MEEEAREVVGVGGLEQGMLVDGGVEEAVHHHLEVCKGVFGAVVAASSEHLPLDTDLLLELIGRSTDLFTTSDTGHCTEVSPLDDTWPVHVLVQVLSLVLALVPSLVVVLVRVPVLMLVRVLSLMLVLVLVVLVLV